MKIEQLIAQSQAQLEDLKAQDLLLIDVREKSTITDYMLIASGTSGRHIAAMGQSLIEHMKKQGMPPLGIEGKESKDWVLVDLGELLVHIMLPATRELYDLERLWSIDNLESIQD